MVLLSHYHADYLSGHTQFNVPIGMGPGSKRELNKFDLREFEDGSEISLGQIKIKVIHTPGHTPESSCYLLSDSTSAPECLFTGDTVFLGDVGRPDLAVKNGGTIEDQASILFDSIQKLKQLDGKLRIYPGHGSGSACGKAIGGGNFCTLETQKASNYGFKFT
jgi:hydroxyacylglutathione hydrolase